MLGSGGYFQGPIDGFVHKGAYLRQLLNRNTPFEWLSEDTKIKLGSSPIAVPLDIEEGQGRVVLMVDGT